MKTLKLLLPVLALASPLVLQAQPEPGPGNPQDGPPREFRMRDHGMRNLPEDVRKRFFDAREAASKDPKIAELKEKASEANKAFFEAMKAKMTEIDPGLNEILEKSRKEGPGRPGGKERPDRPEGKKGPGPGKKDDGPGKKGPHRGPDLSKLSDDERAKLLEARKKAKDDPSVQAAKKKLDEAKAPEDRRSAMEEFRKAMHDAIIKADASLESVLQKIKPSGPPSGDDQTPAPPGSEPMSQQ